jgi:hypothetical protein
MAWELLVEKYSAAGVDVTDDDYVNPVLLFLDCIMNFFRDNARLAVLSNLSIMMKRAYIAFKDDAEQKAHLKIKLSRPRALSQD